MERRTIEQFRLSLFGRMIMGVAHEVDNHLSVVIGFSELIRMAAGVEKKCQDGAGKILAAGERVNRLMKNFSGYVRPHDPVPEPFAVSEMMADMFVFAKYDLGRGNVFLQFPENVPPGFIVGDRRDLALALICLLFNGAEAMEGCGGTLRLEVSRQGSTWEFLVADGGPGIPGDLLPRIFDDGFTTKDGPYHTGMGLPVARHIARAAGGEVAVSNRPEGGCASVLRVPERPGGGL